MYLHVRMILAASLLLMLLGGWVGAQVHRQRIPVQPPVVVSGSDVGVQITAYEGANPVGSVVVRVDGKWLPLQFERGVTQLSTR